MIANWPKAGLSVAAQAVPIDRLLNWKFSTLLYCAVVRYCRYRYKQCIAFLIKIPELFGGIDL